MKRADFLKYFFGKTTSAAYQLAEDFLEPFHQAGDAALKIFTVPLIPIEQYQGEPKLLASSKPPVYLIGELGNNLVATSAICQKDGFLLSYLPQEDALYCVACGSKHAILRVDGRISVDLPVYSLTVKEGFIHLIT